MRITKFADKRQTVDGLPTAIFFSLTITFLSIKSFITIVRIFRARKQYFHYNAYDRVLWQISMEVLVF
jgi:hypothetical protein